MTDVYVYRSHEPVERTIEVVLPDGAGAFVFVDVDKLGRVVGVEVPDALRVELDGRLARRSAS